MKLSTPLIHGDVTRLLIDLDQDGEKRGVGYLRNFLMQLAPNWSIATKRNIVRQSMPDSWRTLNVTTTCSISSFIPLHLMTESSSFEYLSSSLAQQISDEVVGKLPSRK